MLKPSALINNQRAQNGCKKWVKPTTAAGSLEGKISRIVFHHLLQPRLVNTLVRLPQPAVRLPDGKLLPAQACTSRRQVALSIFQHCNTDCRHANAPKCRIAALPLKCRSVQLPGIIRASCDMNNVVLVLGQLLLEGSY
eukprot:2019351-Amphidinium_carterae.1